MAFVNITIKKNWSAFSKFFNLLFKECNLPLNTFIWFYSFSLWFEAHIRFFYAYSVAFYVFVCMNN